MTKNNETTTITVESVVADAAKENLVSPTVPAQATEEKKSVDEFDTPTAEDVAVDKPKFATLRTGDEVHEFDSVGTLLKHITIRALKNRKVQVSAGVTIGAMATLYAVIKKKATEVIELDDEADLDENLDDESSDNN